MKSPEEISSLELMRRIADRLPTGSSLRVQLQSVIIGLSE